MSLPQTLLLWAGSAPVVSPLSRSSIFYILRLQHSRSEMAVPPNAAPGPDAHASYHDAAKALADLLSYLKTSSEQEHWLLELYKRRCSAWQTRSAEGRRVLAKGSAVGQAGVGGSDSQ